MLALQGALGHCFAGCYLLTGAEVTGTYAACGDQLVKVREECKEAAIDLKRFKTVRLDVIKDQNCIFKT